MENKVFEILSRGLGIDTSGVVPRHMKEKTERDDRTKSKAEVFTPVSVVKRMNDLVDEGFSGTDEEYIGRKVLEVTCGEGPFLTTLYDASTGVTVPSDERTGLLDRKLARITTGDETEWRRLAEKALKSTYGYEWQEDSLFLARMNVLSAVVEAFRTRFGKEPEDIVKWAEIVSFNLFRMDGVTLCVPGTDEPARIMNWETGETERFDGKYDEITLW